jgi:hypothetical protein
MNPLAFDPKKHTYRNDAFVELVKDAVRFFNGTPVHPLPPPEDFLGTGVYAIYYVGNHELYARYGELNRLSYGYPIYVGKAVPAGWRQSRLSDNSASRSRELCRRMKEHSKNIATVTGLDEQDFFCRFVIFEEAGSDMISTVEAALIKLARPLWNTVVDGFGNHDPGSGRRKQAMSNWDVIHPGRPWAITCTGKAPLSQTVISKIKHHLDNLK